MFFLILIENFTELIFEFSYTYKVYIFLKLEKELKKCCKNTTFHTFKQNYYVF